MAAPAGVGRSLPGVLAHCGERGGTSDAGGTMRGGGLGGRCSVRLGSPATPHATTPVDVGGRSVRLGPLPMSPCLATPLTTPGGRARATRGGTAAAGGAWRSGGPGAHDALGARLERLQAVVERQGARIDGLCLEAEALRACLAAAGLVSSERFLVHLHRRRFEAARRLHPLPSSAHPAEGLIAHEHAVDLARCAGPAAIFALKAASRTMSLAMAGAVSALEHLFSRSVYICGGFDGSEHASTAERFDPAVGTWEPLPAMLERRSVFAAAVIAGQLYVCGGHDGASILDSAERFDPAGCLWEQIPPMSERRWCAASVVLNNRLYMCGGNNGERGLASVERFDPAVGSWELLEPMAVVRGGAVAVAMDRYAYVCGGLLHSENLNSVERFDSVSGVWETVASMNVGRSYAAGGVIGNRLFMCGGCGAHACHSSAESLAAAEASAWELLPPMMTGRISPAVAVVGSQLYICGGRDGQDFLSSAERYDAVEGRWDALPPMSAGRGAAAAAVLEGRLYVCGGHDGAEFRRSVERFDPQCGGWELLPPMRGRRASACAVALWASGAGPALPPAEPPSAALPPATAAASDGAAAAGVEDGGHVLSPPSMLGTPT